MCCTCVKHLYHYTGPVLVHSVCCELSWYCLLININDKGGSILSTQNRTIILLWLLRSCFRMWLCCWSSASKHCSNTRKATQPKRSRMTVNLSLVLCDLWPLTSWPPKLIVSCLWPADRLCKFASKLDRRMDEQTGREHSACRCLPVWPCGGIGPLRPPLVCCQTSVAKYSTALIWHLTRVITMFGILCNERLWREYCYHWL